MRFLRRKSRRGPTAAASVAREELAFTLLAEARLRCEALRKSREDDQGMELVLALHREFGLAGYFASANIGSRRRQDLLVLARQRATDHARTPSDAVRALDGLSRIASDAVEDALGAPELSDHMHIAHVHLLAACELIQAARSEQLTAWSAAEQRTTPTR